MASGYPRAVISPAQQPRDADLLGWRDDRVAGADVDVEVSAGGREACGHRHPDSWVDVLVPYLPRGGSLQVEHHPVRKGSAGDPAHCGKDGAGITTGDVCLQVDVAGRAAFTERGQQHAALEHEPLGKSCLREPGEEALQNVKVDQLIDRAPVLTSFPAQIEIDLPGDGGTRWCRHSSTARAWRSAGSAWEKR